MFGDDFDSPGTNGLEHEFLQRFPAAGNLFIYLDEPLELR